MNYFRDNLMHCTQMFTWEPVSHLDCPEMIEAYEKAKKDNTTQKKEKEEVKQEAKHEVKKEVKQEVNDTKQWLLKRRKKKSKKVFQFYYWNPIFIIFRLRKMDGNEVSPPKKSLVLNQTNQGH